jgi:hypothetical protein
MLVAQPTSKKVIKMKRKIMIGGILVALMIATISLSTAVSTETTNQTKESPLYKIRTRRANIEKFKETINNIQPKFLGERLYYSPLKWLANIVGNNEPDTFFDPYTCIVYYPTCGPLLCKFGNK